MSDILADLTVQSIAGIISGGLVAAVPPLVQRMRGGQKPVPARQRAAVTGKVDRGGVMIAAGGPIHGKVNVTMTNNHHIVTNNIHKAQSQRTSAGGTDADGSMWFAFAAIFVACSLFLSYYQQLLWFDVGLVVGMVGTAVGGLVWAKNLRLLDRKAWIIFTEVILSVVATVWTWNSVFSSKHGDLSLETLRSRVIGDAATAPLPHGLPAPVGQTFNQIGSFVKIAVVGNLFPFVAVLFAAFLFSSMMILFTWSKSLDWYAYMRFLNGDGGKLAAKRADRHANLGWKELGSFAVITTLTLVFASGLLVQYWDYATHPHLA